ncbi:DNA-binding protein [Rhizobium sophoriradicis]|uniref:helix-turn-helix transcriptional regulator n=1 Tax=Rhizobium sophoriradicis TaxID=1535245 RepID=UPI00098F7D71|nr:helix-turn-helix domain-containing protein [Rhizobium sophoriradicis]RSB82462.1 DNA-binding protein [Rhizobium sophoriradicis]
MIDTASNQQRRMLRTEDAANYTGLSASTLNKFRLSGEGPSYIKIGKSVVYDPADLDKWLSSKRRRSTSVAA